MLDALKRRDKRLRDDKEAFEEVWQTVKESVRQLKHDHKRNTRWKTLRRAAAQVKDLSSSNTTDLDTQSNNNNSHDDEN